MYTPIEIRMQTVRQLSPESVNILPASLVVFNDKHYTIKAFDSLTLELFNAISREILTDKSLNKIPAIAALGFWLRRASIETIGSNNYHLVNPTGFIIEPRGIVFHVCPSNVDTMFMYSLAISLLMGNRNIVRISGRGENEVVINLITIINKVLEQPEYIAYRKYIAIIAYEHDDEISEFFSLNADARILWGGDQTISVFKSFQTKPRVKDIAFADRVSCSVFKATAFFELGANDKRELVRKFFNDAYAFDQMGCSSPQMVFVLADEREHKEFLNEFYVLLTEFASEFYTKDVYSLAGLKLNFFTSNIINNSIKGVIYRNSYVVFAEVADFHSIEKSCGGGFFYVKQVKDLLELVSFVTRKVQTLSYYGLSEKELHSITSSSFGIGIDRVVPVGTALNFDYIWDGYNLLDELCNKKRIL